MSHYHIRWSNSELDWEGFGARQEAEASALKLVRPNETYTIEEFPDHCPRCAEMLRIVEAQGMNGPRLEE